MEFAPNAIVRPLRDVFVDFNLKIEPRHRIRAHGKERKAVGMMHVDQFRVDRRRLAENAEPRKRIFAVVGLNRIDWNRRTADAVEAVAAGNEVARDTDAVPGGIDVADRRRIRIECFKCHAAAVKSNFAARGKLQGDEIFYDLLLTVNEHRTAGEALDVDVMAASVEADVDAAVDERLAMQSLGRADLIHQVDATLLHEPGPNAGFAVLSRPGLQDDRLDAGQPQQMREHQARGPGANNSDCRSRALHNPG